MPSRKPKLYTYWRVDPFGEAKMYDTGKMDDALAVKQARELDAKYDGKYPCIKVRRSTTETIWERKMK